MTIQADMRPWGSVLIVLGLTLVAASFAAAFSIIGAIFFYAGVVAVAVGIFLLRVRSSRALIRALLETVGILIALAMLAGLLW